MTGDVVDLTSSCYKDAAASSIEILMLYNEACAFSVSVHDKIWMCDSESTLLGYFSLRYVVVD